MHVNDILQKAKLYWQKADHRLPGDKNGDKNWLQRVVKEVWIIADSAWLCIYQNSNYTLKMGTSYYMQIIPQWNYKKKTFKISSWKCTLQNLSVQ